MAEIGESKIRNRRHEQLSGRDFTLRFHTRVRGYEEDGKPLRRSQTLLVCISVGRTRNKEPLICHTLDRKKAALKSGDAIQFVSDATSSAQ